MSDWRISQKETIQLINSYKKYECLWNYRSHLYKRTDLKRKSWEEIALQFQKNADDVKKKIKCLRTAYLSEKKKVDVSKKSGSGADDVLEPHLFYYNEFKFLDTVIVLRKTTSNFVLNDTLENEVEVFEIEPSASAESQSASLSPCDEFSLSSIRSSKHGQKKLSKYDSALSQIINLAKDPSEDNVYCDFENVMFIMR